ncbi:L-lactate dehydrogenase [Caballeronia calidae]|uniref:L-lactate dehydrogenase n=1 Tax=Caballeronia calidae TaxID=1777139 RepID=A0A158ECY6_9BURK|nr:alpha-hydroxy acid oxidase [Caballeronia calidae]SAL04762.1 L-lactate dehydrogenase [Caballeronia calidae]
MPSLAKCLNVSDLRAAAKRKLPRGLFEYIDRGVEDEISMRGNIAAFDDILLQPRVVRDVAQRNLTVDLFGVQSRLPMVVAPTGSAGLLWFDGEIALAQAARDFGIPFTLSTGSITSIERIGAEAGGRLWFQLYVVPEWSHTEKLIGRAKAAGFEALVVTVDSITDTNREYNERNGFTVPMRMTRQNVLDCALHPSWSFSVLLRYIATTGMPRFSNMPTSAEATLSSAKKVVFPKSQSITDRCTKYCLVR